MRWPAHIVLASGVFDILHAGHVSHLRQARDMGDKLVVAVTGDQHVNKGPGRPINDWYSRANVLRELRCVDDVVWTENSVGSILLLKPTIFVKGIDYAAGDRWTEDVEAACRKVGAKIAFTTTPKMSATEIIRKAMA